MLRNFERARGQQPGPLLLRYALGLASTGAVTLFELELYRRDAIPAAPLFLFVGNVFIVSWLAGLGPARVATLASLVASNWLFLRPRFSWSLEPGGLFVSVLFVAVCTWIIEVTERMRLSEQKAIRLGRARDEFLSAAAHELKTPLAALRLRLQALEREAHQPLPNKVTGEWVVQRVSKVATSLERLERLMDVLLDMTRLQAGKLRLEREEVDLASVVQEVVARFNEEFPDCEVKVHAHGPVPGQWDRFRLEQVVTNLLSNACKYGDGKPVEISVEADEQRAKLRVRDQGLGIATNDLGRIFEQFERSVATKSYRGLGLGLWISRQIVQMHGGEISVVSKLGQGSTFTVELSRSAGN